MPRADLVGAAAMLIALAGAGSVHADDATVPLEDSTAAATKPAEWLFGDWGGARTRLKDRGLDFQFGYTGEFAYNPMGGTESKAGYADQFTGGITFDLDRLLDIPDAKFQITFTQRDGDNLSDTADLGTLQQVQEVFGRGQTIRLTDFWFQQTYANGLIDWKVGRMPFGEDFAAFSCDFQNLTFCGANPGNLVGNYIFNWPISQWATRAKVNLSGFGYIQAGVYDVNPKYLGVDDQVLPVFFSDSTGAMFPIELGWLPNFDGGTLPGSYKFGGWYDTSEADDVVSDINGDPMALTGLPAQRHRGRYGAYLNFQQQVTSNLSLFFNFVTADKQTSTTDRQIAAGLTFTGFWDARPKDDIGFAVGTTHVNSRVSTSEDPLGSEYAFELYYTFRPRPGLLIRPNLQYIHHPGGTSENEDVIALGLKTSASF
ncbi:carbohydrate porin [Rhizobium sp. BK251]|uniref:carbohydrate porin n=1 Tax=Rhizobium sp. BK251 TaxID=2512125 RepID=UPI0010DB0CD2|nr:carbohydrate porin [Rhizobium sp. BK251]TCL75980.1 OprB family porin [Rhizobium sp. BK251]